MPAVAAAQEVWRLLELQLLVWLLRCGRMLLLQEVRSTGPSVHGGTETYGKSPISGYGATSLGDKDMK